MKSRADKLIAEKLSSLDSLPEGYSPNLDSKWAIIQGSVSKKKPFNSKVWIGIAACLLLLLISTIILMRMNEPDSVIVETPRPAKIIDYSNTNQVADHSIEQNENRTGSQTIIHPKKRNLSKIQRRENLEPALISNISDASGSALPKGAGETQDPGPKNNISEVAFAEPEPVVKKKQRYVEVDFNESVRQSQTVSTKNYSPFIKFKLDFKKEIFTTDYSVSNKPLRIRQNF